MAFGQPKPYLPPARSDEVPDPQHLLYTAKRLRHLADTLENLAEDVQHQRKPARQQLITQSVAALALRKTSEDFVLATAFPRSATEFSTSL